jgi:hypothetical protein
MEIEVDQFEGGSSVEVRSSGVLILSVSRNER